AAAVVGAAAERRDLDDFLAEDDVGEAEAAPDQAAVAEQLADFLGCGAGRDVEVLRVAAEQQVAHRAADEAGAEAGFVQAIEDAQRAAGNVLSRDLVLVTRNDAQVRGHRRGGRDRLGWIVHFMFWSRVLRALANCPMPGNRYTSALPA